MMPDKRSLNRRESANDLPSVKKLRRNAFGLGIIGTLFGIDGARMAALEVRNDLADLCGIVDAFYRLLGDKNWVFSNALNLERMRAVASGLTPEDAERALVEYLKEEGVLHQMIIRLNRFPDMRPRIPLLEKAERDYLDGRYYSSVLVTVSVMDGFVNDISKFEGRRGLHAKKPEELHVPDCVATVWEGLPSVQEVFTKSIHARVDEPVFDVYRHGIMHGMIVEYDNDLVASKAWCMLFAIADWADHMIGEQPSEDDEGASMSEVFKKLSDSKKRLAENNERLSIWQPHHVDLGCPEEFDKGIVESCKKYLDAWKAGNYGLLGSYFPNYTGRTQGAQAGEARELYSSHPIDGYEVEEIDRPAAAIAVAKVRLCYRNDSWVASVRFSRQSGTAPVADWEPGDWKVVRYGADPFVDIGTSCD